MLKLPPHLGPRLDNHHACRTRLLGALAVLVGAPLLLASSQCDVSTVPPPATGVVREVVPAPPDPRGQARDLVSVEADDDGPAGPAAPRRFPVFLPAGACAVGDEFPACAED